MKTLVIDKKDFKQFPLSQLKTYSLTHGAIVLVRGYCIITHGITQFTGEPVKNIDKDMIMCEALQEAYNSIYGAGEKNTGQ